MSYEINVECEDAYCDRNVMTITVDGEVRAQYYDYGEPEDNSFVRDWAWVATELKNAYELGLKEGREEK